MWVGDRVVGGAARGWGGGLVWGDKGRLGIAAALYRSVSTRSITFPVAPLGRYPIPMPDSPTRVMFVEDEATLRKSYEMFFADRYEMEFAASGAEAVTKVKPFAPEVVVLDLRLPDTDGIEVMRRVRDRKSTRLNSSHLVSSYAVFCL